MDNNGSTVEYADAGGKKKRRKGRWWKGLLIVGLVLVAIRLVLPFFVLKYVNKTLAETKGYPGHVEDIDLAILRGAYVIKGIRIDKQDTVTGKRDSIPFFTASRVDLSVEWGALFKGRIAGEVSVEDPRVYFVKERDKGEEMKEDTTDFRETIRDLMPLRINRFDITRGEIHYLDPTSKPALDVKTSNIEATATNLGNVNDSGKVLPAALKATGDVYGGHLALNVKFDALNKTPTFDMNARVESVDMPRLNDFFRAYGNFDVKEGSFGLYTEFAAKDGKFKGYVKPLVRDIDIVQFNEREGNFAQIMWESVIGAVGEIFENQPREQIATKVPISGSFANPEVSLWNAIVYVLRNAFVYALRPSIDQSIDIGKVEDVEVKEPLLKKIFGKDREKDGESPEGKGNRKKDRGSDKEKK